MSKLKDLSNKRFGRLTVVGRAESKNGKAYWLCKCDCGNLVVVCGCKLKSGETQSCGCIRKEILSKRRKKHGITKKSLHNAWINMKTRCKNPNYIEYDRYGGRGITYCKEWENFENFMTWALNNGYQELKDSKGRTKLSLDRIDNNGNYEPSNCRWATTKEQNRNKNVAKYNYNGKLYCLVELAELSTVTTDTIRRRIKNGFTIKEAVETPSKTIKRRIKNERN